MLKDSGNRRKFDSGAVRDVADGKGRADLLPLTAVGTVMGDDILTLIGKYIEDGFPMLLVDALKRFGKMLNQDLPTMMLEVSKHYEDGARKYQDRNWEQGIPLHCFIDSGVRHYLKWLRGDNDEPHDRAFVWNILGALWTANHYHEMIDLPFIEKEKSDGK